MLVGIHQPHYLPWLRYFEKIDRCDVFIVLDTVQYSKNGWQNRNKVKTAQGATLLTAPVAVHLGETLEVVSFNGDRTWQKKHLRCLLESYAKAPSYEEHKDFLAETYARPWNGLFELSNHMLHYFVDALGITTKIEYASVLDVSGTGTERLVNLIRKVGGDRYYSGSYALDAYLDPSLLKKAHIDLEFQRWNAPTYPQLHGAFIPDLSIIDLLMNCGSESLDVLRCGAS